MRWLPIDRVKINDFLMSSYMMTSGSPQVYIPKKGHLIWINFNPQSGHEQVGHRPAFVISSNLYNRKSVEDSGGCGCPSFPKHFATKPHPAYEIELTD